MIINTFVRNRKRTFHQRNKISKELNENFRTEKYETEIKAVLGGPNSGSEMRQSVALMMGMTHLFKRKKKSKNEQGLRELWVNNKRSNIHVIKHPEADRIVWCRKKKARKKAENFPSLAKSRLEKLDELET